MKRIIKSAIALLLMIITISVSAQSGPGGPGSSGGAPILPDYGNPGPTGVPFDGGLSIILLAVGAGLGTKKKSIKLSS